MVKKIVRFIQNISLRERMILVYVVGCLIPLLITNIYLYNGTKQALLSQATESETMELTTLGKSLMDSMNTVSSVSKHLYFSDEIEEIAFKQYTNYSNMLEDYRNFTIIPEYVRYNYHDISSICVYVENTTISDNEYFKQVTNTIRQKDWYITTLEKEGSPVWSYQTDIFTQKKSLRLTRVLYTKELEFVGVLSVTMQKNITALPIGNRGIDTLLLANDNAIIESNFDYDNEEELLSLVQEASGEENSYNLEFHGERFLMTEVKIQPEFSEDYYTVVSIQNYNDIVSAANRNTMRSLVPIFICMGISLVLIGFFTQWYSKRIRVFKNTMHRVATGDFTIDTGNIIGTDEIGLLYQDLNHMIGDIQSLMQTAGEERVQKEQLYARQKEVEFKMLASQINPHFLYNTLENIRMIALVNHQSDIEQLTRMLTKLLRHNIQVGQVLQTLESELEMVECYLKIQDYRFHDRITSHIEVDLERIHGILVMPLLIQPFIENAFIHGLESEINGMITIRVIVVEDVYITIEDNGCGMSKEKIEEVNKLLNDFDNLDRTHIGICNVNQRIKLKYGDEYGVSFDSELGKGTRVTIVFPAIYDERCS